MKALQVFTFLTLCSIIVALTACAANKTAEKAKADALARAASRPPHVATFTGSYLAGRFAQRHQDWEAAQNYMNTVLKKDTANAELRERTFLLTLGAGDTGKAKELAHDILASGADSELSNIFLACDDMARDDLKSALAHVTALPDTGFGQYTKPLMSAWVLAGMGRKDEALKLLADSSNPDDPTYRLHAGMIEEMSGNNTAAATHYKAAMANGLTLHGAVTVGDFFARTGRADIAQVIYDGLGKMYPFNPFIAALAHQDPHRVIAPSAARAADGAAFALYDLATLLYEKHAYDSALVYNGMVRLLQPASPFAMMMSGDIAALHQQYPQALESYNSIPQNSPLYWLSRMRVAESYEISGHLDQAIGQVQSLTKQGPLRVNALVTLGDMQRRHENYAEALKAYDAALAEIGPLKEDQWPVIYARGMSLERLNRWQLAEKDLLKALELQPDNPMILNFIGYSWVTKGIHMDKAVDYLKRAASLKPDDGYVLDSYGWALYRTGQYDTATKMLEQAVAQIPDDSTILDHLGDAYWETGRRNEARFKWLRASETSDDAAFKALLQQKLRAGLATAPVAHLTHAKEAKL